MIGFHPRKFTIALLAQVVFCLVAAPILAAEQWAAPLAAQSRDQSPQSRPTIEAAFDASNVRPEEVSEAEQKKGTPRTGINRSRSSSNGSLAPQYSGEGSRADAARMFREAESTRFDRIHRVGVLAHRCLSPTITMVGEYVHPTAFRGVEGTNGSAIALSIRERFDRGEILMPSSPTMCSFGEPLDFHPAVQPTGPPAL